METDKTNKVHKRQGLWFFWNDTHTRRLGGYGTEELCREELKLYNKWVEKRKREVMRDDSGD